MKQERGSVLVGIVIFAIVLAMLMAVGSQVAVQHRKSEQYRKQQVIGTYKAEGCVAYAMAVLWDDPNNALYGLPGGRTINLGTVDADFLNTSLNITAAGDRKVIKCTYNPGLIP